jgi:uncharacterized membrane protein
MTMASKADQLVEDYLKRLDKALRDLPKDRRNDLLDEISGHIAEARADLETESEGTIRTLLDRLGEPEDIAAEAEERYGTRPKGTALDIAALILLLIGGVVLPVVGWIVGVVLLWISETWTTRLSWCREGWPCRCFWGRSEPTRRRAADRRVARSPARVAPPLPLRSSGVLS